MMYYTYIVFQHLEMTTGGHCSVGANQIWWCISYSVMNISFIDFFRYLKYLSVHLPHFHRRKGPQPKGETVLQLCCGCVAAVLQSVAVWLLQPKGDDVLPSVAVWFSVKQCVAVRWPQSKGKYPVKFIKLCNYATPQKKLTTNTCQPKNEHKHNFFDVYNFLYASVGFLHG